MQGSMTTAADRLLGGQPSSQRPGRLAPRFRRLVPVIWCTGLGIARV
jgi:hypothetical protein